MNRWLRDLILRDGPHCHLCGCIVDIRVTPTTHLTPSRDHIIPMPYSKRKSNGKGKHRAASRFPEEISASSNIKLAHAFCNSYRGQSDITPELLAEIREQVSHRFMGREFQELQAVYAKYGPQSIIDRNKRRRSIKQLSWDTWNLTPLSPTGRLQPSHPNLQNIPIDGAAYPAMHAINSALESLHERGL